MTKKIEINDYLTQAIRSTWQAIAPDAGDCSNAEAIELCCDAGRLAMYGGKDGKKADERLEQLVAAHGWEKVDRAIRRLVKLA